MNPPDPQRTAALHGLIATFIAERLQAKLDKIKIEDPTGAEQEAQLRSQHDAATWLDDAARRSSQLQVVTHALKGTHPDAKGSSLRCDPAALPATAEVGSHCLGDAAPLDVVGNAAALDVFKLLKQPLPGEVHSLLALSGAADSDWLAALSADPAKAAAWAAAFAGLEQARGAPATHTLAKQVYWQIGLDAHAADGFHLLAPLYPTALVHRVHEVLQAHRFGEPAKLARAARKAGEWHDQPTHDYPQLAFQQLGGTKPQNISQLNSERRGANPLLASLPPQWDREHQRPPLGIDTLFELLTYRPGVRDELKALRRFLESDPDQVIGTRERRNAAVERLLDALIELTAWARDFEPGWSLDATCRLPSSQRLWLDPDGFDNPTGLTPATATEAVADQFGVWLNQQLRDPLSMDANTALAWRTLARDALRDFTPEASHAR